MNDEEKTKEQLIQEIAELRKRCATLEITASECKQLESEIQDAREYAENIVEAVREPLVVLNAELKILTANHSFHDTFNLGRLCEEPRLNGINSATKQSRFFNVLATARLLRYGSQ